MPVLNDTRQTKKVALKTIKGGEVEIYTSLKFGDFVGVETANNDIERGIVMLEKIIKDWNLTDKDGNKLPVNMENIKKLDIQDVAILTKEVTSIVPDLETKKKEE